MSGRGPGTGRTMTPSDPARPPADDRPTALVLDVDGTLLDTVYLHVLAWWESFLDAGHEVSCVDVHRAIGRSSSDLVESLIGRQDDRVVEGHEQRWAPLRERCLVFHGVPDLIRTCAGRGLRIVYCTSGSPADVEDFRRKIGCDDVVTAVVDSGAVEPAPDIVLAAIEAAGVDPDRAVMVGDSVYDVRAAKAAGVTCLGLRTGGVSERELREAGAVAVYGNPSELLQELDASPVARLLAG